MAPRRCRAARPAPSVSLDDCDISGQEGHEAPFGTLNSDLIAQVCKHLPGDALYKGELINRHWLSAIREQPLIFRAKLRLLDPAEESRLAEVRPASYPPVSFPPLRALCYP